MAIFICMECIYKELWGWNLYKTRKERLEISTLSIKLDNLEKNNIKFIPKDYKDSLQKWKATQQKMDHEK